MHYHIDKDIRGNLRVKYLCQGCSNNLLSPLKDAGSSDSCPQCGARFIVPGKEELRAHNKKVAEDRARQSERKVQRIEQKAAGMLEKQQRRRVQDKHDKTRSNNPIDRFLLLMFKIARFLSVIIIFATALTAIAAFITTLVVWGSRLPDGSILADPAMVPKFSEAERFVPGVRRERTTDTQSAASPRSPTPTENRLDQIAAKYGISSPNLYRKFILSVYARDHDVALSGLEELMEQLELHQPSSLGRRSQVASNIIEWYLDEFSLRRAREQRNREIEIERAKTIRQQSLTALLCAVGLFLAFVYLPLLIQIERNTRDRS